MTSRLEHLRQRYPFPSQHPRGRPRPHGRVLHTIARQQTPLCREILSLVHLFEIRILLIYSCVSKMAEIRRKLVIVGDGACGKTCLLM